MFLDFTKIPALIAEPDIAMERGRWSHLTTVGDAVEYVMALLDRQLERAELERVEPNEPTRGDGEARAAFLSLLPPDRQRQLFLALVRRVKAWPRIRTLIGSPPFSFLGSQDDNVLRAAGVTRGRVHMASGTPGVISSLAEFGVPQFVDENERDTKFVNFGTARTGNEELLPFVNLKSGRVVAADVRLKRRKQTEKIRILRYGTDAEKRSLRFPGPGNRLVLKSNSTFRGSVEAIVVLRVRSVLIRGAIARIIAVVD